MATSNQTNLFSEGLDLDTDKNLIKNTRTTDANEVEYSVVDGNEKYSLPPFKSTTLGFTVPIAEKSNQIQRLEWKGPGTYTFAIYDNSGNLLIGAPVPIIATTFNDISSSLPFIYSLYGYTLAISSLQGNFYTFSLCNTLNLVPFQYSLVYSINSVNYPTFTIQDTVLEDTVLIPIASNNIQNVMVVFSCGKSTPVDEIGMVKEVNGEYIYTRIIRTNKFGFDQEKVFRVKLENQANDFYGVYWTDRVEKPKAFYFPKNYSQDCALKYTPSSYNTASDGYYTLSSINQTTDIQLYNSIGRVEYSGQLQSGGYLLAGGYRYAARFGFKGTQNVTPFSYLSQLIPVFKTSIDSESAYSKIQGDVSGTKTGKANILQVDGCMAEVFDYVELACVYNANGVNTATIFGKYDLTSDSIQVTHYGNEADTISIDPNLLIDVSEVILKSGDLEIKKNRLNLANNTVAVTDSTLSDIVDNWRTTYFDSFIQCGRKSLRSVGKLNAPDLTTVVKAIQPLVGINSLPPLDVNNTVVYTQEILDLYNEYNNVTGAYTLATIGVNNIIMDFGIELVFASTFDPSTCSRADVTISKNGFPIITGTKNDVNIDSTTGNLSSYFTSLELFGNNTWTCDLGDVFTITMRLYGNNLNSGGIRFGTRSYINISYIDTSVITDFKDTRPGEYQLPENVAKYTGYMYRDRYPMYLKMHLDNGYVSKPIYAGTFPVTMSELPRDLFTDDNNLNEISVYAYHAILNNLPISALRNAGVKGVSVWRGIMNPKVLGSGVYMTGDLKLKGNFYSGYYAAIPNFNGEYNDLVPDDNQLRRLGMLLSPDIQANQTDYAGGTLVVHGVPTLENFSQKGYQIPDSSGNQIAAYGAFAQYKGYKYSSGSVSYSAVNGQYCDFNTAYNTPFSSPAQYAPSTIFNMSEQGALSTPVLALQTEDPVNPPNTASQDSDNGLYLAQYEVDSILDTQNIKCVPTGCFIEITPSTPDLLSNIEVFGGDTYTQKSIRRLMYGPQSRVSTTSPIYSFITYYAQNRVNTQLFYTDLAQPRETYNLGAAGSILRYWFPPVVSNANPEEQFNRDLAYTAPDIIDMSSIYNPTAIVNSKYGSRIWYSEEKPTGSVYDYYRQIKPLNFKDLDAKNGDITALCDVNDLMIAIQPNAVSLLPYQSDVALTSQNSAAVYTGAATVYAQREEKKSDFGSSIRTGVHIAKNENGNSTLFWFCDTYSKLMKFSPTDGIRCVSEDNGVRSWFINKSKLVLNDWDIILGYNIQLGKLYITSRAADSFVPDWNMMDSYTIGDVVNYQVEGEQNTFEYLPNLYTATAPSTGVSPFGSTSWQYIQPTDTRYYNYWTLIYSEKWKAFTTFTIIIPRRYFELEEFLFCPNPRSNFGAVYKMDSGDTYMQYFDQDGDYKQGIFSISAVINDGNILRKKYKSVKLNVGEEHVNNPTVTVSNQNQIATILPDEMELRGPNLCFPVKTDGDDRPIISGWAEVKIVNTLFMKITNFITTFAFRERKSTK